MMMPKPFYDDYSHWVLNFSNVDAITKKRRMCLGAMSLLLGGCFAAFGFYDISVWNAGKSHWCGIVLFIVGAVVVIFAVVLMLILAFPQLFDSGNRGI